MSTHSPPCGSLFGVRGIGLAGGILVAALVGILLRLRNPLEHPRLSMFGHHVPNSHTRSGLWFS